MLYLKISNKSIPLEIPKHIPTDCSLEAFLKSRIQDLTSIPSSEFLLLHSGRILNAQKLASTLESGSTIFLDLSPRLRGGKGGFGSLLKSQKQKFRTSNFDSMRDLSGRRMRHVNQEQMLRDFTPPSEERVNEIHKEFDAISKTGNEIEKRKCYFGAECKYKHKCRYLHPGEGDQKLRAVWKRDPKWNPNFDFNRKGKNEDFPELDLGLQKEMERSIKNMEVAAKRALKIVGSRSKGTRNTAKTAKKAKTEEKKPAELPETECVEKEKADKGLKKAVFTAPPTVTIVKEKIDLGKFSNAMELEGLGACRLKEELQSYGLKCGGTVNERAARLFQLKTKRVEELPRSFFPKKRRVL